jgi:hypothetical protein
MDMLSTHSATHSVAIRKTALFSKTPPDLSIRRR